MFLIPALLLSAAPASADEPLPTDNTAETAECTYILLKERLAVNLNAPVRTISFSGAQLDRLTFGDQPAGFLNLVPGVHHSRSGTTIGGATLSESAVMLDGVILLRDGFLSP